MRSIRAAAAVALALALAAAGCGSGGGGAGNPASERGAAEAIDGLYAIDHGGANPKGDAVGPYREAFEHVEARCDWGPLELASQVANLAQTASNGSGTTVSNLDALHAVVEEIGEDEQDCAGLFVGVEARLEGSALTG